MKFYLPNWERLLTPGTIRSPLARTLTRSENIQLTRIFTYLSKEGADPNVASVSLRNPLSPRQILWILNSDCAALIEAMFQILVLGDQSFSVDTNNKYSLLLYVLFMEPHLLPVLRTELGWKHVSDCTDTLKEIRVFVKYYQRPKRTQRHKGYRDKGSLPDRQFKLRQECLSEYYAEEALRYIRYDQEIQDTISLLVGYLS